MVDDCWKQWIFVSEGQLHSVYSNGNATSKFSNQVLKITKLRFPMPLEERPFYLYDVHMIRNVMVNWFSNGYAQKIVSEYTVPNSVLIQFLESYRGRSTKVRFANYAYLEKNFFKVPKPAADWLEGNMNGTNNTLSFEIKVKSGSNCISPFNKLSRRLKLKYSRYEMMQIFRCKGKSPPPAFQYSFSEYNPENLCSQQIEKVYRSLNVLFHSQSKNMTIFNNGNRESWPEKEIAQHFTRIFHSFLSLENERIDEIPFVISILSKILVENTVLQELRYMQKLDILDSEGAAVIFSRLTQILSSEAAARMAILERVEDEKFGREVIPHLLQFARVEICSAGAEAVNSSGSSSSSSDEKAPSAVVMMRALFDLAVNADMSEEQIVIRSDAAFALVDSLDASLCVDLLVIWIMAIIAKDAGVIVSIERLVGDSSLLVEGNLSVDQEPDGWANCYSLTVPSNDCPGALLPKIKGLPSFAYSIGVVDIGMKPLSKIHKRYFEEENLVATTGKWLQANGPPTRVLF